MNAPAPRSADVLTDVEFGDASIADDVARVRTLSDEKLAALLTSVVRSTAGGRWVAVRPAPLRTTSMAD